MRFVRVALSLPLVACVACITSNSDGGFTDDSAPHVLVGPPDIGEPVPLQVIVPTDERPPVSSDVPPPAISGGTLLVTANGMFAVASDPERDRVSIVHLGYQTSLDIALEPGDEPGRLVEDDSGHVHVALRRGGAIASIDVANAQLLGRREVCGAPRGVGFDGAERNLVVACADGELVTMPADGGEATSRVTLTPDLRDVVLQGGQTFVTRFKHTDVMHVADGSILTATPAPLTYASIFDPENGSRVRDALEANVAWRTVADGDGSGMVMVHQSSRLGEIELPEVAEDGSVMDVAAQSSYGGGGDCSGVVQGSLTTFDEEGAVASTARMQAVLPVDVAVTGQWVVVAQAGTADQQQPARQFVAPEGGFGIAGGAAPLPMPPSGEFFGDGNPGADVLVFDRGQLDFAESEETCMFPFFAFDVPGQAVATAFAPDGSLVVQSREPATIAVISVNDGFLHAQIALGGAAMKDTGHEIFHRDAGGGIACATCHAEGAEDGHVWTFAGFGPRRTQALHVGLKGTEPFHWEGDKRDFGMLMDDVFVARMGGVHENAERTQALANWLFSLTPPSPIRDASDEAAVRGKALFEGDAQCASCHSGNALTNNETVDVGTDGLFQVPSLVGIAYRAPFVHTGCANTLRERFDPACGGARHGNVEGLSGTEIDDLVAYLETL